MCVVTGEHLVILGLLHHHHLVHTLPTFVHLLFNAFVATALFVLLLLKSQLSEPSSFLLVRLLREAVQFLETLRPWALVLGSFLRVRWVIFYLRVIHHLLQAKCVLLEVFTPEIQRMPETRISQVWREHWGRLVLSLLKTYYTGSCD